MFPSWSSILKAKSLSIHKKLGKYWAISSASRAYSPFFTCKFWLKLTISDKLLSAFSSIGPTLL